MLGDYLAPALIKVVRLMNALPLQPPGESSSASERQNASRAIYSIERPLIVYCTVKVPGEPCPEFSGMFQAAAQLYVLIALRALPIYAPKVKRWVTTLGERIDHVWNTESNDVYGWTAQSLLLWAYAVLIAARPESAINEDLDVREFVTELLRDMGLSSMESIKTALRQITWAQDFGGSGFEAAMSCLAARRERMEM